jgi:hypothetical protein
MHHFLDLPRPTEHARRGVRVFYVATTRKFVFERLEA